MLDYNNATAMSKAEISRQYSKPFKAIYRISISNSSDLKDAIEDAAKVRT